MRNHAHRIAVSALLLTLADLPASAQGLNLGVKLPGVNVGVNLGGGNTGVSVGVGSGSGSSSGSNSTVNDLFGLDVQADLFGPADGSGNSGSTGNSGTEILSQQQAVDAVVSRRALPLDQVMVLALLSTSGEIIDANLVNVRGYLLYVFKVLETDGDVSEMYFYARSGQMVESR